MSAEERVNSMCEKSIKVKSRKMQYKIRFVTNPFRKDKHKKTTAPVPRDRYLKMLFDEIESVFRGDKDEGEHERPIEEMETRSETNEIFK